MFHFETEGAGPMVHIVTLKTCDEISYDSLANLIFLRLISIYLLVGTVADPTLSSFWSAQWPTLRFLTQNGLVYICRLHISPFFFDVKGNF